MSEARSALVIDDPKGNLGMVALRLIRLGIDSFYAPDPDEALLLAQQEAGRIRLLLVAPAVEKQGLERILEQLEERVPDLLRSLVAIGPKPDEATRNALREAGVEWALWEPWDDSALRTVVSAAMAPQSVGTQRRAPRIPTTLLCRAFIGIHRKDGLVSSLSEGGAFLEMPHPFPVGTRLTLEIELGDGSIVTKAEVRYTHDGDDARRELASGMGVAFRDLAPEAKERLARFLHECQRFEV
jgi:hypothetical protein